MDEDSARLGLASTREKVRGINADHAGICRFADKDGLDYKPAWKNIKILVDGAIARAQAKSDIPDQPIGDTPMTADGESAS